MSEVRERFAASAADPNGPLDLPCLLLGTEVEPTLDIDVARARLDSLAQVVGAGLPGEANPAAIGRHLRATLGGDVGFAGATSDYDELRSSLLHEVLRSRRGLPILLSVVWLEVARRIDVPAYGIGLPGHFVVGIGDPDRATDPSQFALVDPFAGGTPVTSAAVYRAVGHEPTARDLRPWDTPRTVLRILANIRTWASRTDRVRTRLWALELSLLLPGCPEALRREHGETLARTGEFAAAATALEAFAERVEAEHPLVARSARQDARTARSRLN
ncbi:MAG TPA: transglutaminase-like domain-containing protein [Sporichthyaceae bacterium]|jgi:regulator of sirC expression with transglutaminase-like and TPR domain